jgi:hypothetical protein
MFNSAPKWHKLMPDIPNVWFSCGNSNIRDLLQILATEIQTNFNNSPRQNVPKLCWKVKKKTCPQNRLKNTRCKGVHAIERPAWRLSRDGGLEEFHHLYPFLLQTCHNRTNLIFHVFTNLHLPPNRLEDRCMLVRHIASATKALKHSNWQLSPV